VYVSTPDASTTEIPSAVTRMSSQTSCADALN
jgi:hypothetical protein